MGGVCTAVWGPNSCFPRSFQSHTKTGPHSKKRWGPDLRFVTRFPLKKLLDTRAAPLGRFAVVQEGSNGQGGADVSWRCQDLHTHTCAHGCEQAW